MMDIIFAFGIVWVIYGFAGLLGFQVAIPKKAKARTWTKRYIRSQGLSWILLGVPWIILACASNGSNMHISTKILSLVLCSVPALLFTIIYDRKYKAIINEEEKSD